jgi:predicted GNAT family acetyltransferase
MQVVRFEAPAAFAAEAEPYLLQHEAAHCLPLGIVGGLVHHPDPAAPRPYLALVRDGARIAGIAVMTPPFNLVLSLPVDDLLADDIARLFAEDLHQQRRDVSGVLGRVDMAGVFADGWRALTGGAAHLTMRERIYELTAVTPPRAASGRYRLATTDDRSLLIEWMDAFHAEALPGPESDSAEWVDRALATPTRTLALWEDDGGPVSLASAGNPTAHGVRVGPVYTPPERRGRGYASACVAELSQRLLDSGRQFCFLFTDLANPTSNHIYQTIGYRPVMDVVVQRFDAQT